LATLLPAVHSRYDPAMPLIVILLASAAILAVAYWTYGRVLSRLLRLDPKAKTPASELRDDVDYVPTDPKFLFNQHFSAIAAAGPIVGPILAGVMFGWGPAIAWILFGAIFIGGVHDITSLTASIRHGARSIAEIVRLHMNRRSYLLFLTFMWIALVYVVVAFTDIVASSFVGTVTMENGLAVTGAGIATSSLLYLALPIVMGLLLRYTKLSVTWATVIFLPLVGVAIWMGPYFPLDLAALLGVPDARAQKIWDVLLLVYCFVASIVPMWLLLQPRGHLGGYFLIVILVGGLLGLLLGDHTVQYPAFRGWQTPTGDYLMPMLFITIACGACSGFHSIVASGTTSKQLRTETDARPVAYGAMLLEALVAVLALACVMRLAPGAPELASARPNFIFSSGLGAFLETLHIPAHFAISFALLAFTTFVYDTLDVCTRLARYILQELTGWKGRAGRYVATGISALVPLFFVMQTVTDAAGKPVPSWRVFWPLFGASNQLLAALTLIAVTVWLYRTRRAFWVWPVAGLPAAWMFTMSILALTQFIRAGFFAADGAFRGFNVGAVPWAALVLCVLAGLLLIEAVRAILAPPTTTPA
jgi:carbon starvation protein